MWLWSVSPSESLLQPTSSEYEPSWVDKPRVRGTFDILSSCILTLIICTYTTVHVDIPCYQDRIRKDSWWIKLYPRLSWMVLGLLTPELIVMSAWLQYMAARKVIMKLLRTSSAAVTLADSAFPLKVGSDPESQEPCTNRPGTWKRLKNWLLPPGLERGFYIVMGGFYIVVDYDGHGVNNQIRKTVTPEGVVLLQQLSLLPSINIEAIRDKSKVDSLSKVLMCLQISWMVVQSIARKANGLPLTLLEFNTVVHVGCALLMYILWLKKPQDVGFPMEVTDPRAVVLLLIKRIEDANRNKDVTIIDVKEHVLEWEAGHFKREREPTTAPIWTSKEGADTDYESPKARVSDLVITTESQSTKIRFAPETKITEQQAKFLVDYYLGGIPNLGPPTGGIDWKSLERQFDLCCPTPYTTRNSTMGLPDVDNVLFGDFRILIVLFCFLVIYGGLYLATWTFHFPTVLERNLWRLSALGVLVCPLFAVFEFYLVKFSIGFLVWFAKICTDLMSLFLPKESRCIDNVTVVSIMVTLPLMLSIVLLGFFMALALMMAYPFMRVYLLLESFASLRNLPLGSYETLNWTEMWPHW